MDVRELVTTHYGGGRPQCGDPRGAGECRRGRGEPRARRPVPGGPAPRRRGRRRPSTRSSGSEIGPDMRLLDVGCGIGGPSRLAATYDAQVTGVDLTPEFVDAATTLTERVGLGETGHVRGDTRVRRCRSTTDSFDAALMVHVGMNIPDKLALFTEVHRVLAPGGRFAVFDQMRTGDGSAPLPDAVGRGPAFVVRGDRQRVHRPPGHRRLHGRWRSRTGRSRRWDLHRTARCRR